MNPDSRIASVSDLNAVMLILSVAFKVRANSYPSEEASPAFAM